MWRRSTQRFFSYFLYFHVADCGAVFEDGSINRKTDVNELRILKVESRIEIGSPQAADREDEKEASESK